MWSCVLAYAFSWKEMFWLKLNASLFLRLFKMTIIHYMNWFDANLIWWQYRSTLVEQYKQLDESTARRQLKSPRSLSGRSIHLTLVTKWSWSWSWMTYCHPLCAMSMALPFWDTAASKFDHENPWSRSCVWSKVKVMFDLHNSKVKVMVKVKPNGHIWGLEFNRYVCFSFRGNRTNFGWDIGNFIFDLENSRSRSWPRSNLMVTFEAWSSIDMFVFLFVANRPFLAQI